MRLSLTKIRSLGSLADFGLNAVRSRRLKPLQLLRPSWAQLIVPLLLGALSGCTVGPNYHEPKSPAKSAWNSPLTGGETNLQPVDAAWWQSFHDTELDTLIARAVASNRTLRVAEARVREARAQRGVIAAGQGPHLEGAGSYSRNRFSRNGFPPLPASAPFDYDLYKAGFDASWELDVFGATRRAVEAANAQITAAQFGRDDVLRSLLGEVARNYVDARALQRRLGIAQENIQAQQRIVSLTRDRYRAGLTTELDVQEAIALLDLTQSQVPTLEAGFRQTTFELDVLLGQPAGRLLEQLTNAAPIPDTPPVVPVGLPSDLLLRRPDIRQAERQLAASTARIGVAKADLFPRFSLTGAAGLQSLSVSDWWTEGSRFWSAGPTVTWRLFESGRLRANIRVQNARQAQTLAQYEQTVLVSFEEVESALTAYAKEQIRRRSLAESLNANQRALNLAEDLYRHGLTDFLRVLSSQRGLYQAQDALAQSDQAVALDLIALYKALGGGWGAFPPISSVVSASKAH